ncbi:Spo0E family sporulation regulatory protein-aspartic acid phosphatase [Paenibacillus lautus]|uniref:Spo0E family sporulation regulatory protein-aspartic acid phosphatase n=1 Tax=Paenibacillus lautus TaxID=1401 RepID=UPI003D2BF4AE
MISNGIIWVLFELIFANNVFGVGSLEIKIIETKIIEVRQELYFLAEKYNYNLQHERIQEKSIELDNLLNAYIIRTMK